MTSKVRTGCAIAALAGGLSGCVGSRPLSLTDIGPEAQTSYFTLHSDPWINLHHFLYAWAQEDAGIVTGRPRVAERGQLTELAPAEHDVWIQVLRVYRDSILHGGGYQAALTQLWDQIARGEPTDEVLIRTLARAMPIYRERWWPEHRAANTRWIMSVAPRLAWHEERFVQLTRRLFAADWTAAPWRIDVSAYAPRLGYATSKGHVVIHSTDRSNRALSGVELIFHEMQHLAPIAGALPGELERVFREAGTSPPAEIGHALIQLTAGECVRATASAGSEEHVPFWIARQFADLPEWRRFVAALEEFWLPALQGEATASESLVKIAGALRRTAD